MKFFTILIGIALNAILLSGQVLSADKPLAKLQGTWKVTKCTINGKEVEDPQITKSQLEFSGDELVMKPGDGTTRERFTIKPEADSKPAAIYVTRTEPADRPQEGWEIFELKEGRLRMAFYDALIERPKSFDPKPKLIVLELEKVGAREN